MIRISLLVPSYSRPKLCLNIFKEWVNAADAPVEIEFLIGLDAEDSSISSYYEMFSGIAETEKIGRFEINIGNTTNCIQVFNNIIRTISNTSELILSLTDDMHCITSWDTKLLNVLLGINNFTEPKFILVSEGHYHTSEKFNSDFSKDEEYGYYIANKAFYSKLGYVFWPEYTHFGADTDIFAVAKKLNSVIDARNILIKHDYYQQNQSEYDITHSRKNTNKEWETSHRILAERKSRNFNL